MDSSVVSMGSSSLYFFSLFLLLLLLDFLVDDAAECSLEEDGEETETGHMVGGEFEGKDCGGSGEAMSKEKLAGDPSEDIEMSESTE